MASTNYLRSRRGSPPSLATRVEAKTHRKQVVVCVIGAALLSLFLDFGWAAGYTTIVVRYFVSGSTVTYPLYVNAAVKAAVPPQINVLATAILVISLVLLAAETLYRRKRIET